MTVKTAKAAKPALAARVALAAKKLSTAHKALAPRKAKKSLVARKAYPVSYAGKWVAWSHDGRHIVASSKSLKGVMSLALRAGYARPILERVPRNVQFVLGKSDS